MDDEGRRWLMCYCGVLDRKTVRDGWAVALAWLRPLVPAFLAGIHPAGSRVLPVLILMRGLLQGYCVCAVVRGGLSAGPVILRGLLILPCFYWLCCRAKRQCPA